MIEYGVYNFIGCKIIVNNHLNFDLWESLIDEYHDKVALEFLKYGFPIGYSSKELPKSCSRNHKGGHDYPNDVDLHINKEMSHGATLGHFKTPPFNVNFFYFTIEYCSQKGSSHRRRIMDLSFPPERSVNDGIFKNVYLGEFYKLSFPSIDSLIEIIWKKGPSAYLFKRDLSRAYRQLPVDPADYPFLGYSWRNDFYFDIVLPFGLRSAAMMCQRTTNAINFIFHNMGFDTVNYLDDFGGCDTIAQADLAFHKLGSLLKQLGIAESEDKAVAPSQIMVFLRSKLTPLI